MNKFPKVVRKPQAVINVSQVQTIKTKNKNLQEGFERGSHTQASLVGEQQPFCCGSVNLHDYWTPREGIKYHFLCPLCDAKEHIHDISINKVQTMQCQIHANQMIFALLGIINY